MKVNNIIVHLSVWRKKKSGEINTAYFDLTGK